MNSFSSWLFEKAYAADPIGSVPSGLITKGGGENGFTVETLANNILDLLIWAAYPLAFLAFVYTSYLLIISMGKPEAYATAKKHILWVITGIFLIIFANIILGFIMGLFNI
jgi:hypothetical protein